MKTKIDSKKLAWKIRKHAIEMTYRSNGSHIGAILSIADVVAVLYSEILNVNPQNINNPNRDKFLLSKGHAGAAIYAALAEMGFFPIEELLTHCQDGSRLSGHISHKHVPGVEFSTGSLGHAFGVAAGFALSSKLDNINNRIFVLMGDGECNEGSVWEAAMFANHFKLSNLCVIIDHNKLQSLDTCKNTIDPIDLAAKWQAFGFNVLEIEDGHNHQMIKNALIKSDSKKPNCVILHTIKGKGISFMEGKVEWHYRAPLSENYTLAVNELESEIH